MTNHLKRLADIWDLLCQRTVALERRRLHDFVFGHDLLELLQGWCHVHVGPAEVFLHVFDEGRLWD